MQILLHSGLFIGAILVLWLLSGILVEAIDRVARRYEKPGFAIAFFVLGFLTSISEMSVAVNSTIEGVPQISAGNLVGASLVIFLLLIPLLAVVGKGIPIKGILSGSAVFVLLVSVLLPSILMIDGNLTRREGMLLIALYIALVYWVKRTLPRKKNVARKAVRTVEMTLLHHHRATAVDILKMLLAASLIFVAGRFLVDESVYFSSMLGIPASLIGLLLLALGTNIPECVIALRCVTSQHKDIAFGDYMGSAAANVPIIGVLALANGTFAIDAGEFLTTGLFLAIGLTLFFFFARSDREISRKEGALLLALYLLFIITQITAFAVSAPQFDAMHAASPR